MMYRTIAASSSSFLSGFFFFAVFFVSFFFSNYMDVIIEVVDKIALVLSCGILPFFVPFH